MPAAISVKAVSKKFLLKRVKPLTLRESFLNRIHGRHDPGKLIWALKDVSFELEKGRSLGVIGHNGAGKSTLLRLLCGIGRPTSGTIRTTGLVNGLLQLSPFHPLMTGRENVRTAGMLSGLTRKEVEHLEDDMIAFAELDEFIDQPVRTYSTGMSLRLAFSAAVHFRPEILIIDEILTVGDLRFKQKCEERLREFRRAGKTLVLTSHEMDQMKAFCDEVIIIEEGKIVCHADPQTATEQYRDLMRLRTEKRAALLSAGTPHQTPEPEKGSRTGTQEVSVQSVEIQNHSGLPVNRISSGTGLTIEMDLVHRESVQDFALSVGIYTPQEVKCFEGSLPSVKKFIGSMNGKSRVQCRIPGIPLSPGKYFVHIGVYPPDWSFVYDYHWQMHSFDVIGQLPYVTGLIAVAPDWYVNPKGAKVG